MDFWKTAINGRAQAGFSPLYTEFTLKIIQPVRILYVSLGSFIYEFPIIPARRTMYFLSNKKN